MTNSTLSFLAACIGALPLTIGLGGCRADGPNLPCTGNECTCDSGETIDREWICDGANDCGDWQDEEDCPGRPRLACEGDDCTCDSGKVIDRGWICDGDNDCGDGQDEEGCRETDGGSSSDGDDGSVSPLQACWDCPLYGNGCTLYYDYSCH
jgi:low density lipoprotein-related protein 2